MDIRFTRILVLLAVVLVAPAVFAEEWPPYNHSRFVVYYVGTCGVSKVYNGHFEVDCAGDDYYGGTRSGRWRITSDTDCDTQTVDNTKYEVCTTGGNCTATSGTWQEITQQQWQNNYCP